MNSLVRFAQSATYDLASPQERLPPVVWSAFTLFNKAHGLWRWHRWYRLYRQPDHLVPLLAGHAAHHLGEHFVNKVLWDWALVAAQCLLVATRLLEGIEQHANLWTAGKNCWLALKGHYLPPLEVEWERGGGLASCSPTTVHWWKRQAHSVQQRIERVAFCLWNVGKEAFKLSMKIMDLVDAASWSPSTAHEGIDESFVNIKKWVKVAAENREELLEGLVQNRPLIEKILGQSPFTYERLYEGVSASLSHAEKMHRGLQKISHLGGKRLIDSSKRAVGGVLVVAGLAHLRPTGLAETD